MRMAFPHRASAVLPLVAALAACAGGPPEPQMGAASQPVRATFFISPHGEPFVSEMGQPWPSADWFIGADENLDGEVTFQEFAADGQRWFGLLDLNSDGNLNQGELSVYEQSLRQVGAQYGGRPGPRGAGRPGLPGGPRSGPPQAMAQLQDRPGGGGPPGSGPPGGGPPGGGARAEPRYRPDGYGVIADGGFFNLPQPVKAADVNLDQRVTAEEWATMIERRFIALDTDRDGKLMLETLPKTPLQAQSERRRR